MAVAGAAQAAGSLSTLLHGVLRSPPWEDAGGQPDAEVGGARVPAPPAPARAMARVADLRQTGFELRALAVLAPLEWQAGACAPPPAPTLAAHAVRLFLERVEASAAPARGHRAPRARVNALATALAI
jgi:hypothetical protein